MHKLLTPRSGKKCSVAVTDATAVELYSFQQTCASRNMLFVCRRRHVLNDTATIRIKIMNNAV